MDAADLGELRHDLKNVLTALKSGCILIERGLSPERDGELLEHLAEMRAEIDKGTALLGRLRAFDPHAS